CMLASAIAAHLAKPKPLEDSVREGKLFVLERLQKCRLNNHSVLRPAKQTHFPEFFP
ncbi:MAG: hypothetical protein E5V79_04980, partial [Mesorhizobium sp.]